MLRWPFPMQYTFLVVASSFVEASAPGRLAAHVCRAFPPEEHLPLCTGFGRAGVRTRQAAMLFSERKSCFTTASHRTLRGQKGRRSHRHLKPPSIICSGFSQQIPPGICFRTLTFRGFVSWGHFNHNKRTSSLQQRCAVFI